VANPGRTVVTERPPLAMSRDFGPPRPEGELPPLSTPPGWNP
jgi:hypothetical protein